MVIALLAALGIAVKSVIVPLVHMVTGPLFIPGGIVAGGIYMMFLVLACAITNLPGSGFLCGLTQGIIVLILGVGGSHGALSILSYSLTGLAVDLIFVLLARKEPNAIACFFGGMAANLTGSLIVNAAFFSLPLVPLVLSLAAGALSGGLGGLLAWVITKQLRKLGVVK